jgi:pimeloyl-ACP methyl ester carboxylesterase
MAEAIPGAKFVLVPEAGHLTPLEQPEAVTEAIRDFLLAKIG